MKKLLLILALATPALHAAPTNKPSTDTVLKQAIVVHFLTDLVLPFTQQPHLIKQRIIKHKLLSDAWLTEFDAQGRIHTDKLEKTHLKRYLYDANDGFKQYENGRLTMRCEVDRHTKRVLNYRCTKGLLTTLSYDATTGVVTILGKRRLFLSKHTIMIRNEITLNDQLNVVQATFFQERPHLEIKTKTDELTYQHQSNGDILLNLNSRVIPIKKTVQSPTTATYTFGDHKIHVTELLQEEIPEP